jgi:hypothetical protein
MNRFLNGAGVPVTLLIGVWIGAVPGFWVAFGLLVVLAVFGGRRDANSWGDQYQLWSSTFRCSRCGTVFAVLESKMQRQTQIPRIEH